ncbi:MAG: hypothetical protein IPG45_14925 [Deltaproteobacteria bacterium]|nr:hypothetical protein [Deltaproteobacteria bacterium]
MKTIAPRMVLLCLGLGACGIQGIGGERAQAAADPNSTGDPCPTNERCSPAARLGLAFIGASLVDELPQVGSPDYFKKSLAATFSEPPVRTWAAGGSQEIRIDLVQGRDDQTPLSRNFGTDVSSIFAVLGQTPPKVQIRAASAGSGLLRIVEPSNGLLLDRISITAAQVERVQLEAFSLLASGQAGTALLEGTRGLVAIKLEDRTGNRLVDQSARLVPLSPTVSSTTGAWDLFMVGPVSGPQADFQLNLGDGSGAVGAITVVDRIDRWVWLDLRQGQPLVPTIPSLKAQICVYPEAYGLDVATVDVHFRTEDPSLNLSTTTVGPDGLPLPPGCVQAERSSAGSSSLIAEVGGLSDRITLAFRGP